MGPWNDNTKKPDAILSLGSQKFTHLPENVAGGPQMLDDEASGVAA